MVFQTDSAYIVSACLNVAAKLRIPDLIGETARNPRPLALEAGAGEERLFRGLRVLETAYDPGIPHRFRLTPAGLLLRRGSPGSLAAGIEWIADLLR
jgi:hypothetical protein